MRTMGRSMTNFRETASLRASLNVYVIIFYPFKSTPCLSPNRSPYPTHPLGLGRLGLSRTEVNVH